MTESIVAALQTFNEILDAGNAITAFSLLLYSLTFNPRELVARSFAMLLGAVTFAYFGDVLVSTSPAGPAQEVWLRLQWFGVTFLPAAALHLSDALLASTGRPSKGRRRLAVRLSYLLSTVFFGLVVLTDGIANGVIRSNGTAFLGPGKYFGIFLLFLVFDLSFAGLNLVRAFRRCLTSTSRRRMAYLMVGFLGPILGGVPFLTIGGPTLAGIPMLFELVLVLTNGSVAFLLVLMAYSVAYFGVSFPDRIVKSRLFQWILRGPVVASTVLAVTVLAGRASDWLGISDRRAIPFLMVATLLLLQYLFTLVRAPIERWLFYGRDRDEIVRLQVLQERLLTTGDLRQYLEAILNAICDVSNTDSAFVAVVGEQGLELEVAVGKEDPLRSEEDLPAVVLPEQGLDLEYVGTIFRWEPYWLIPLRPTEEGDFIGIVGLRHEQGEFELASEEAETLGFLADRATLALSDRLLQREVFETVDRLVPHVEEVQRIRAAARYGGTNALTDSLEGVHSEEDLANLVKDALGHYWGGPRLSRSPLMSLRVVRDAVDEHEGNPVNALRAVLRSGIDRTKPEGDRRFTAEWMLYNILEMKFLEGRKVRDIAMRLAMSEADLYRKQRIAIEEVARAIAGMEREAAAKANQAGPASA